MFVQGYVTVFLRLCDLGDEERHKDAMLNCVPQGMGRRYGRYHLQTYALLSLPCDGMRGFTQDLVGNRCRNFYFLVL